MKSIRFIIFFLPVSLFLSLVLMQSTKHEAELPIEPVKFERVLTHTDSFLYRYDTLLTEMIDSFGIVGGAAVITINGEIKYLKCFGVKKAGEEEEVDAGTIFRLASVSKPISGVLAGILANDSIVGLDDRVLDYMPTFRLKDTLSTNTLTVRHLLSHTSGLVPHAYDNLIEDGVPFSVVVDSLFRVNISDRPGQLYGYQNVLFSLYDTISTLKTGVPFESLINQKVFAPLGMYHASAGLKGFSESTNKAFPHGRYRGAYRPLSINDRYYNTKPAAGINASISDMGHFLQALTANESSVIPSGVIDSVFTPQVISPLRWIYLRHWDGVSSKHYGLGWRIIGYKGYSVAYHGGYVRGYRAEVAVCREKGIGIAFLTNSPGRLGSQVVPQFLDMYLEEME